jgi:hypothetical protein
MHSLANAVAVAAIAAVFTKAGVHQDPMDAKPTAGNKESSQKA